jgi:hypothetical protein
VHLLLYRPLLDLIQLHVEAWPELLQLDVFSRAFAAKRVGASAARQARGRGANAPVQVVAELHALAAVGKGHDALAFGLGDGEDVFQYGGGALAKAAAPGNKEN